MRQLVGELMDDPTLPEPEHRHALQGLARLNRASGAHRPVAQALLRFAHEAFAPEDQPMRVLDIAAGSGDLPIAILQDPRLSQFNLEMTAADISQTALDQCENNAREAGVPLTTLRLDALKGIPPHYDCATCSLFLHHLTEDEVRTLAGNILEARIRYAVFNDLRRGPWGRILATVAPKLLTRSRVVHVDAVRSERAAFTIGELVEILDSAGMHGVKAKRTFPARMLLTWSGADA
jgi:SAM-dependent methyltransferase